MHAAEQKSVQETDGATAKDCVQWLALYTAPRHEKRVAEHLSFRQVEFFLPLYRTVRKWRNGTRPELELPLFPGYVFVHINRFQRGRVLEVPGALALVGSRHEPSPLLDMEIESLRNGIHLRRVEPHPYLVVGERVRITTGPLVGWQGVLVRKKNNMRVVLTLDQIMRSIAIEVDATEVEPTGTHS